MPLPRTSGKRDDSSAGGGGRSGRNTNSTLKSDDKTDTSEAPVAQTIPVNSTLSTGKSKAMSRNVEGTKMQRPRGRGSPTPRSTGGKSCERQQAGKEDMKVGSGGARNVKLGVRRGAAASGSPARQKPSAHTSSGTPVGEQKPLARRGGSNKGGGEASSVAEDMSGKAGVGLGEGSSAKSSDREARGQGGGESQAKSRSLPGDRRVKSLHAAAGKSASLERGKVNPVVNESKGDVRKPGERLLAKLSLGLREKKAEVLTPHLTSSHQPFFQGINAPCSSLTTSPRKVPKRRHDSSAGFSNSQAATSFKRRRQGLSILPAFDPCTGRRRNFSSSDAEAIAGAVAGGDNKLLSTFYPDFPLGPVVYTVWERGEGTKDEKMLKHRFVRCKPVAGGVCALGPGSEDSSSCDSGRRTEAGSTAGSFRPDSGSGVKVSSTAGGSLQTDASAKKVGPEGTSVSSEPSAELASKGEKELMREPVKEELGAVVEGDASGRCGSPPTFPLRSPNDPEKSTLPLRAQDASSPTDPEKAVGQPTVIAVRGTPGK